METKKVTYRPHRGSYTQAMSEAVVVANLQELREHILIKEGDWLNKDGVMSIERYGHGIDQRNGWVTHIVLWNGSPVGFTSDMLE